MLSECEARVEASLPSANPPLPHFIGVMLSEREARVEASLLSANPPLPHFIGVMVSEREARVEASLLAPCSLGEVAASQAPLRLAVPPFDHFSRCALYSLFGPRAPPRAVFRLKF